jgi:hypothetical protein
VPPKRLLSISGDQIKLAEPSSNDVYLWTSAKKYAALSHCWGPTLPIKTLHETIEQFKMGINWHALTATFQDGITVARRLGIDWIWIDSLCIIQNDTSNWEVEASKMPDYYKNAYITISATNPQLIRQLFSSISTIARLTLSIVRTLLVTMTPK